MLSIPQTYPQFRFQFHTLGQFYFFGNILTAMQEFISTIDISLIVYSIYSLAMIVLSISIMLENRNPNSTIAYLLTLIFLPVLGLIIYLIFGQNFRKKKIFSRKIHKDNRMLKEWEDQLNLDFKEMQALGILSFHEKMKVARLMAQNNRAVLTHNNTVEVLTNGEEAFPEMYRCIAAAKHHIHADYYIIAGDEAALKFVDALIAKAREGIEVRVSYDDVGSSISRKMLRDMRDAGVQVHPFMPVQFPNLTSKINYRNHKKILVIDGQIGFVGGMNISNNYTNDGLSGRFWRDTHLKLTGDSVRSLQVLFVLNWAFVSKENLIYQKQYFPPTTGKGQKLVQIAESGPDSPWPSIMQGMFAAINSASSHVYIQTPYFIPNEEISSAIKTAALSGIDVRIMIPHKGDSIITQSAAFSFLKPIVEAGAKVYLYQKGMLHAKTLMVDGNLSSVGTANMDQRSFDLNFEVNAFIFDVEITAKLESDFIKDMEDCVLIDQQRWQNRTKARKLIESLARILAPVL